MVVKKLRNIIGKNLPACERANIRRQIRQPMPTQVERQRMHTERFNHGPVAAGIKAIGVTENEAQRGIRIAETQG